MLAMRRRVPGVVWGLLFVAAAGWNVAAFRGSLGEPHPTMSTLTAMAMTRPGVRWMVVGLWVVLGWRLLRRGAWVARAVLGLAWLALGYHLFLDAPQVSP